jgi:hypothetical protein
VTSSLVRIYRSELDCIINETAAHPAIETGGSIYGLWTDKGHPTIFLAIGPGPRAERSPVQFQQDLGTHQNVGQVLLDSFGMHAVGLWHSHHKLGLHELSGGDLSRTMQLAQRTGQARFCDLLTYLTSSPFHSERATDVSIKPYVYTDAQAGRRAPTTFVVLPGVSPVRESLTRMAAAQQLPPDVSEVVKAQTGIDVRTRLERSVELGARNDDDAPQKSRGIFGRKREPANPDPQTAVESSPTPAEPQPAKYAIPDLIKYMQHELEPVLAGAPPGLHIEAEPLDGGQILRLTVTTARQDVHEFDLGWSSGIAVVTRHRIRKPEATMSVDGIEPGKVVAVKEYFRAMWDPSAYDRGRR